MGPTMSHAGESLWDRHPDKKAEPPGVRHDDLRALNRLVSNIFDDVTILDFDRAELGPSDGAKNASSAGW
jgi:aminoglycoside phosphotransferase (APT) family kinase protein